MNYKILQVLGLHFIYIYIDNLFIYPFIHPPNHGFMCQAFTGYLLCAGYCLWHEWGYLRHHLPQHRRDRCFPKSVLGCGGGGANCLPKSGVGRLTEMESVSGPSYGFSPLTSCVNSELSTSDSISLPRKWECCVQPHYELVKVLRLSIYTDTRNYSL